MKKMILILFIILMITALLPAAAFADTAKPAEEAHPAPVGWKPFALPKNAQPAPAFDYAAEPDKAPGSEPAKTDKPANRTPEEIMDEIIARCSETAPVKLMSIAVIPYIPDGRPLPCK